MRHPIKIQSNWPLGGREISDQSMIGLANE